MGSRQHWFRAGAAVLLIAAVAVAVAVPGVGKWIVAAVLTGLASALGGLVARSADKAIKRGRDAVLDPASPAPIIVKAHQSGGLRGDLRLRSEMSVRDWVEFGSPEVCLESTTVDLVVEATVDRAVIISKLEVRVESRGTPPRIFVEPPALVVLAPLMGGPSLSILPICRLL